MFDFLPTWIYVPVYYNFLLLLLLLLVGTLLSAHDLTSPSVKSLSLSIGIPVMVLVILYMGTRPISYRFGDMVNYNKGYDVLQSGGTMKIEKDYLFNYFMVSCAKLMPARMFFLLVDIIYIVPCYLFTRKYFKTYWFYAFFMIIASYSFWSYGTNGLRNGIATSLFIAALMHYDRKWLMYVLFALSYGFHSSVIIPLAAFVTAGVYKNPKFYLYIWLGAIPLSLIGAGFWESFFGGLEVGDSRAADYLNADLESLKKNEGATFSSTGFRWDFLLYSSFAAFAGWYFIFKKKITDSFYIHLWGTFMIANAFWILVIRAAFSNRFAYLSWFLMAPVIIYPFLRYRFSPTQHRSLAFVLVAYYLFTYIMFLKS